MVVECLPRRGAGFNQQINDNRRGRRWAPPYQRQTAQTDSRPTQYPVRQPPCNYRPHGQYRNGALAMTSAKPSYVNAARPTIEKRCVQPVSRFHLQQKSSPPTQPQFQLLYQEFENMKKRGLVLGADPPPVNISRQPPAQVQNQVNTQIKAEATVNENFADAMKIFMKSYYPTSSLPCAKPVEDWSKEAGNLLQELTDKECQYDMDTSVWNIPCAEEDPKLNVVGKSTERKSSWSTTPPKKIDSEYVAFDIHRHIMELNPSPYPGGSPVSTGQSASNHSSDNDADDESNQSACEQTCKAIGTKKSLKKRLHSSFTCTTMDSGYLSSANESDGSRGNGFKVPGVPGAGVDSDDLSSECGFTTSTCPSWPSSPLPPYTGPDVQIGRRLSSGSLLPHLTNQQLPQLPMGVPPIPPPVPPYLSGLPPPHFLPAAPFHPAASVGQLPITRSSQLPPPPPPMPGFAFMGSMPPPQYQLLQHALPSQQSPIAVVESQNPTEMATNGFYHKHKAWITDEILEMIAVRDRLYKRMKKHPAPDIVEMYKKVRNMVVGMTRNAKRSYEKQFEEQQMEMQLQNRSSVCPIDTLNIFNTVVGQPNPFVPLTWDRSYV